MKRFAMAALFAAAILTLNSNVQAGIGLAGIEAGSGGPGVITTLEDDDWEILVQGGDFTGPGGTWTGGTIGAPGSNTVGIGDIFVGMIRISQILKPGPGGDTDFNENGGGTISAIFAIKLAAEVGGTVVSTFLSNEEWAAVGLDALGFTRVAANTIAVVFDDPDNVEPEAAGDGTVTDDLTNAGAAGPPTNPSGPNGTRLWEFGITDAENFWVTTGSGGALIGATIPATGLGDFATFNFGLNQTHAYPAGDHIVFHPILNAAVNPFVAGDSQLLGTGSVKPPGFPTAETDFDLVSDTDLFISTSVVPEPGSMILLGMGAMGVFGAGYRRRRQAEKQQAV